MKLGGHQTINIQHGNGGKLTHELIRNIFLPAFSSTNQHESLHHSSMMSDGAALHLPQGEMIFTTDAHVVKPLFFKGGSIGTLAVNGTCNDLAVMGACPLYLSASFIIEEGFSIPQLLQIVNSMQEAASLAEVCIVTGDTKVVERGAADGLYISTAGVGVRKPNVLSSRPAFAVGDVILLSGTIGDHGMALYAEREGIELDSTLQSDCASIYPLVKILLDADVKIRIMRDPTRGGVATTLKEFADITSYDIEIDEKLIPVQDQVRAICEILGFDPLYVASEGKFAAVVARDDAELALRLIKNHPLGKDAAVIGTLTDKQRGELILKTAVGGMRILDRLTGDMLPRIC